jgi:hypothetical protein
MSELSLAASLAQAELRLGSSERRRRADAGGSRLPPAVEAKLRRLLGTHERRPVLDVWREIDAYCRQRGLRSPSRATVYNAMARVEPPRYQAAELPEAVRRCLHNVESGSVPGHQVAFAAFNYGDARALSFAAGMPWSCLHRAARMPGFRPKSLGLLRAIISYRGI